MLCSDAVQMLCLHVLQMYMYVLWFWVYCKSSFTPAQTIWAEGLKLAANMNCKLPLYVPTSLTGIIKEASADGIHLISELLQWNPKKRPTSAQVSESLLY